MLLFIVVITFIVIAGGLTWFFLANNRGGKEPVSALWAAAGFGFLGIIGAALTESLLIPNHLINNPSEPLGVLLLASLGVGVIEESFKSLPLALFIYKKSYFNSHSDGVIYFALAGLGFGIPENILYTLQFGAGTGLTRIILTPLFHAATTGMVGFFLAKSKVNHKSLVVPGMALVGAMLIHGLYDFGLMSRNLLLTVMSLMITAGITTLLFVFFMLSREEDKDEGLDAVSANNFCRICGSPNPSHTVYCINCGQHA